MKTKNSSTNSLEMSNLTIRENKSSSSLISNRSPVPSLKISSISNHHDDEVLPKVSEWYDTDGYRVFMKSVKSGDIVELRNSRTSHWGIAIRLKQPPSPNGKKQEHDEVMIYHLIHSQDHRGQVGQYTIEEFWTSDCRIRINNTTNGMCLYGKSRPMISKSDVLDNAFTAHMSNTLKWQTCTDFIRWTCDEETHSSSKSHQS